MIGFARDVAKKTETLAPGAARRGALVGLYLVALSAGYMLGERGTFPVNPFPRARSSPEARLGAALSADQLVLSPEGFRAVRADVEAVRARQTPESLDVLDLVVAVRGFANHGEPNFREAEERCRALRWPRCDRPALEVLRKRSRP
jgi:hypothetical protein